jgi:hypothetical protein
MARSAVFVVTLSRASTKTVTVNYATAPGTAVAPGDFTAESGTLTFLPGQTTKQVMIPIRDPLTGTVDEHFTVVLSSPVNATIAHSPGIGTIPGVAAPALPVASINNVTVL